MMNLSFHLENIFSCCTHMTPFLTQESLLSRRLGLGPEVEQVVECSDPVPVTDGGLITLLGRPLLTLAW